MLTLFSHPQILVFKININIRSSVSYLINGMIFIYFVVYDCLNKLKLKSTRSNKRLTQLFLTLVKKNGLYKCQFIAKGMIIEIFRTAQCFLNITSVRQITIIICVLKRINIYRLKGKFQTPVQNNNVILCFMCESKNEKKLGFFLHQCLNRLSYISAISVRWFS